MPRSLASAVVIALVVLAVPAPPAAAQRLVKGRSLVEIGVGGHRAQLVIPGGANFGGDDRGEVGVDAAYYRFLSDQWTFGVSGGFHGSELKYGTGGTERKLTSHTTTVRVGGDRYAFIDDGVALYAGPGVIFTRGHEKVEAAGGVTAESPDATEVGLNGRIGMYARLGKGVALFGHIGQVLSRTSAENGPAKPFWWTSTHEGAVGLAFDF